MKQIRKIYSIKFLFLFCLILLLNACQTTVYQNLTEKQVNEMLALLLKHGVQAEKTEQGKNGFALTVDENQLIQSLEILNKNNLPRQDFKNLGDIFKGDSMISSNSEENARLSFAISQELSETFSRIDGVLTARVHIVLGNIDQATEVVTSPSAAVFLRHTPDSPAVNYIAKMKELIAKSVPNLQFDDISVMLIPVREEISVPNQKDQSLFEVLSANNLHILTLILLIICFIAGSTYLAKTGRELYEKKKKAEPQKEE